MTLARGKEQREIGNSSDEIDNAEAGHRATDEIVRHHRLKARPGGSEVIAVPERRPGHDDEKKSDFQKERHENESTNQKITLAPAPG